ncbi:hypothetical protein JQ600_16610 [Bradyrhizobium sp. AUGA SZCCT0176]|uniref:hypothetical protein n=1 Tax=Bradyrhizobium sp. AUGA SZCCT0176 TaxID=2807664 RepID=UPI001BAA36E1|nr:hypothetical protein [Bradyrhizobium sp. AUGA SZCCT0176]MBR1226546.1 hypothetical protein [Bradyrhizobium sp. AUGA SZCCT0176]
MGVITCIGAAVLWWLVASYQICCTGGGAVTSGAIVIALLIAVITQAPFWMLIITFLTMAEFVSSRIPGKWSVVVFTAVTVVSTTLLTIALRRSYGPESFTYRVIVYPAFAVALLYVVRSMSRRVPTGRETSAPASEG